MGVYNLLKKGWDRLFPKSQPIIAGKVNNSSQCGMFYDRVLARIKELKTEETALEEHVTLLRREKMQLEQNDSQLEEIRRKEMDLAEVHINICTYNT